MRFIVLCLILLISCAHAALREDVSGARTWGIVIDHYETVLKGAGTAVAKDVIAQDLFGFIISGKAGLTQPPVWNTFPIDRENKKETDREKLRRALRTAAGYAQDLKPFERLYQGHSSDDHAQACWTIFTQAYATSRAASATPVPSVAAGAPPPPPPPPSSFKSPAPSGSLLAGIVGAKLHKTPEKQQVTPKATATAMNPLGGSDPAAQRSQLKKTGSLSGKPLEKQVEEKKPLTELEKKLADRKAKAENK